MPCQAPAKTTKAMKHFRKQNKIHAGQTTVSHNQHDTLSNKHNINVNCDSLFAKTATNSLLPTSHIKKKNPSKCFRQTVIHNPWLTSNYQTTIHATTHPKNRGIPGTQPMPNIKQTVLNPYNKRNTWSAKRNPYATANATKSMQNKKDAQSMTSLHNPCDSGWPWWTIHDTNQSNNITIHAATQQENMKTNPRPTPNNKSDQCNNT